MNADIVILQFSEHTKQVKAIVKFPEQGNTINFTIDDAWIQQTLKDNNFEQFYILPEGIAELKSAVRNKQPATVAIAEGRDAEINITLEDSNMHAYLQIIPPYGGKEAMIEDVYKAMKHMSIKEGIDNEAIQAAVEQGKCARVIIASGKAPVDGDDAYFEVLVEEDKHFGPTINEQGVANFTETNELSIVKEGEPLMRRVPRTLGENGMDVLGNLIYPVPGESIQFAEELDGADISKEDEHLLVAIIKGHPIIEKNRVRVDPTYVLERVNLATGNINFDGSVFVKGDVEINMQVIATGDITINGCAIKATIEADGNININQGIIGGEIVKTREGHIKRGANIKCGGILTAGFIDNTSVHAQGNIFVKDYVAHSDMISNGDIVVGSTGYKGHIVGGSTQALNLVSVNVLGNETQAITKVKVGTPLELAVRYEQKEQKLQEYEATLSSLSKAFIEMGKREAQGPLNNKTKNVLNTLLTTLKNVVPFVNELEGETRSLKAKMGDSKETKVIVRERVYYGVELNLCDKPYIIGRDMIGGVFELQGEVTISPLGVLGNKAPKE